MFHKEDNPRSKTVKILIIHAPQGNLKEILSQTEKKLESVYETVNFEVWNRTGMQFTRADIAKTEADMLLTFDLAGFEQSTLMGGLAYNLVNCKQIHILLHDNLPNESCLSKQLSIAMFFYCSGVGTLERLQAAYPDIPYLKELGDWKRENTAAAVNENAEILCDAIREVAEICHIR